MQTISNSDSPQPQNVERPTADLSQVSLGGGAPATALGLAADSSGAMLSNDFIPRCTRVLIKRSAHEMGVSAPLTDWVPYERALAARLEAVRVGLSRQIVSLLRPEGSDCANGENAWTRNFGLFQIHTDTHCSFWVGMPSTQETFPNVLKRAIDHAQPFRSEELQQLVADVFLSHCYAGTVPLSGLSYAVVKSSFVTMRLGEMDNS